ncbi:MAG: [FeFe] hydrogenase H-cluster maturation GTPase HydF [Peptococcaceae bacterium]|nr:[FeFe] hydrogenase H-cluster maturation GTPase HydF [Peptococcaceae bacterium]
MGLNKTPSANRIHIGFFGKRNSGKSSLVNAVTGQELAVVSDIKGTTTDPVYKAMELLPLGPVIIIDTPGFDDEGALGELRVKKTRQVLNKTDIAVLVIDSTNGKAKEDEELIALFKEKKINYIVVYNKADLISQETESTIQRPLALAKQESPKQKLPTNNNAIYVSAKTGHNIDTLKEKIAALAVTEEPKVKIVGDLIDPLDFVVLVTPIDEVAPKGRLILPQQQTIRDILDTGATAIVVKDTEFRETLAKLGKKPKLVITDSQVFEKVSAETPEDIFLTSFSILFARYKGNLDIAVKGVKALKSLQDGDNVLISEGCTHHRQCEDIGTVKLPRWIKEYTQKQPNFKFTSGTEFPDDLSEYKLIVHCGGCMLNGREMKYRYKSAVDQYVPITNYGILIAYVKGILKRSIAIFPDLLAEIEE